MGETCVSAVSGRRTLRTPFLCSTISNYCSSNTLRTPHKRSPTTVAPRIWSSMTHSRYNHSRAIISYLADVPVPTSAQFDWKSSNHRISKKIYSHGTIKASLERKFDAEQESMRNKSKSGGRSIILSCHTCKTFSSPVQSVQSNHRISRSTLCQHDTKRVSIERQLIVAKDKLERNKGRNSGTNLTERKANKWTTPWWRQEALMGGTLFIFAIHLQANHK